MPENKKWHKVGTIIFIAARNVNKKSVFQEEKGKLQLRVQNVIMNFRKEADGECHQFFQVIMFWNLFL